MTDHLAAIREAATKIITAMIKVAANPDDIGHVIETDARARKILRLLDGAEKDGTCLIEPPDVDIKFYHCSRCACTVSGGFREGAFGEGEEWWNDPYCPGCGRRIEGGGQG